MTTTSPPVQAGDGPNRRLVLPGLAAVLHLAFHPRRKLDWLELAGVTADDSLVALSGPQVDRVPVQTAILRLATGTITGMALLLGLAIALVLLLKPAVPGAPDLVRHLALVGSALLVATLGVALCVSSRAAVAVGLAGSVTTLLLIVVLRLAQSLITTRLGDGFGTSLGTILGATACVTGLAAAAASLAGQEPSGSNDEGGNSVKDILDAASLLLVIALIGLGLSTILGEALRSLTGKELDSMLKSPLATLLGLLLGSPFLIAAWRRVSYAGEGQRMPKVIKGLAGAISFLGAAAANVSVNRDPHTVEYGLGVGVLAGGLAGGLFAVFWQWTDTWKNRRTRATVALLSCVVLILFLAGARFFNPNYNRQLPALFLCILLPTLLWYLVPRAIWSRAGRKQ